MDIIQLIITLVGFIGLFVYQHFKIKTLKDQTAMQTELFQNIKTYFDIINPEMLKYRLEQYEKLTNKKKSIEFAEFEQKLSKDMEIKLKSSRNAVIMLFKAFKAVSAAFIQAMLDVPHARREIIINEIENDDLRKEYQKGLPMYEERDKLRGQTLLQVLSDIEQGKVKPLEH
jgi:hypothetical protein